jgi:hypothetical protein
VNYKVAAVVVVAAAVSCLVTLAAVRGFRPRALPIVDVVRVERVLPRSEQLDLADPGAVAMTADGRASVYVVRRGATTELALQYLDKMEPVRIPGTVGALSPFLSANGTVVGFFTADGALHTIEIGRDASRQLLTGVSASNGACFGPGDSVIVSAEAQGLRVVGSGRNGAEMTRVDRANGERLHSWPRWIPALNAVLFTVTYETPGRESVAVARLDKPGTHNVLAPGLAARYVGGGVLIAARHDGLWALDFDASSFRITNQQRIEDDVAEARNGLPQFDAGGQHIAYVPADAEGDTVIATEDGQSEYIVQRRGHYTQPRLSPDRSAVAVTRRDAGSRPELAIVSMSDGSFVRTWPDEALEPRWSTDGLWVVFARLSGHSWNLEWRSKTGAPASGPVLTTRTRVDTSPWLERPQEILESVGGSGIWVVPVDVANESGACPTPVQIRGDGRVRAFATGDSPIGRHVTVLPTGAPPVTLESGTFEPVWSLDGSWLLYRRESGLWRRRLASADPVRFSAPELVIPAGLVDGPCGIPNYDVSSNGAVVVSVHRDMVAAPSRVRFILNFRGSPRLQ